MKPRTIRTSVDIPRELHRRLRQEAARRGCSARQLIVSAIEQTIAPDKKKRTRLILERPLLAGSRKPTAITNKEIYELGIP